MTNSEKAAYIRGLMEGMDLDPNAKETKLFNAIVDLLDDLSLSVEEMEDAYDELSGQVDEIDEDLGELEEEFYDIQRNRHIVNPFHLGEALADDGDEILMLLLQLVQLVVRRDGLVDDQPFDQTADVQIQTDLDVACNPQAQLGFNRPDDRFDVAENDFRVENRQIVQQIFHREVPQQVVVKLLDFVRTHEFVKQLGDLLDVLLFDQLLQPVKNPSLAEPKVSSRSEFV